MPETDTEAPNKTCRHCRKPIKVLRGLWYHSDRPRVGAAWCNPNLDIHALDGETVATPVRAARFREIGLTR